jgi:hypothetical protein
MESHSLPQSRFAIGIFDSWEKLRKGVCDLDGRGLGLDSLNCLGLRRVSPLRRRMIEDMTLRGFGEKTQSDYIRHVKNFTIFLGRSPDTATSEDLRAYQLHQRETGVQPPTINSTVAALRFFLTTTCDQPDMARHLRIVKLPQKLPVVLTPEEVLLLLEAAPGAKYKTALAVAYGAGLEARKAELLVSLLVWDHRASMTHDKRVYGRHGNLRGKTTIYRLPLNAVATSGESIETRSRNAA